MARYLLSEDSYVCIADRHAVFLDLRRDKYTALDPEDTHALRTLVRGLPHPDGEDDGYRPAHTPSTTDLANTLVEAGLLTESEQAGKPAIPVSIEAATAAILDDFPPTTPITLRDVIYFIAAWVRASVELRYMPLKHVVRRIRRRRDVREPGSMILDHQRVRRATLVYLSLRPHFFSNANACLRDSITFVEFLARYQLDVTCVFGVRMNPFSAHAWVQKGSFVLNDYLGHIRTFTPIMTV